MLERQGGTNMRHGTLEIDRERCKGCGLCVRACPFTVLALDTEMNSFGIYPAKAVKPEACTACSSCFRVCPDVAITVFEREDKQ